MTGDRRSGTSSKGVSYPVPETNPIVKEAREAGQRLVDEAGGTLEGYFELLRRREKERKWPVFRKRARRSPKTR